jgi:AcrR family transcriptional regulator
MATRTEQRQATRQRILDAAIQLLIDRGYAATSTVAIQEAAGVSRGAYLHHFPTIQRLTHELVARLVADNERNVREAIAALPVDFDPVSRAVLALHQTLSLPTFHAEIELWAAARTNSELLAALRNAEHRAGRDLRRVMDDLFGEKVASHPNYRAISDITIVLFRGLAVSRPLQHSDAPARRLIAEWSRLARILLDQ